MEHVVDSYSNECWLLIHWRSGQKPFYLENSKLSSFRIDLDHPGLSDSILICQHRYKGILLETDDRLGGRLKLFGGTHSFHTGPGMHTNHSLLRDFAILITLNG